MYYCLRQTTKKNLQDYGYLNVVIYKDNKKNQYSTKILLKKKEWEKYASGEYIPSVMMTSQKIKYGAFALVLSQLKALINDEPDLARVPFLIYNAKEAISDYQKKKPSFAATSKTGPVLFTDFYKSYIDDVRSGKRLKYKSTEMLAESTIQELENAYRVVCRYEEERNHRFTLDEITMDFQRLFLQWRINNGCLPNTLTSNMSKIRLILRAAHDMDLTKNREYLRKDFVPKNEEVENVFLTPEMVKELENLNISTRRDLWMAIRNSNMDEERKKEIQRGMHVTRHWTLMRVRDLFLLGVYTGQRFSDYSRICKKMIVTYKGRKFIKLIQQKEKKKVMIPLDRRVTEILKRYDGHAPKIAMCVLNANIKLLGEILDWTWYPDFDESRIGKKAGPRFCDMISSHTARRTFATNAYAAGAPLASIMAVTGHSTEEKLRTYLKLQPQDKAMMATRDFDGYIDKYKK